MTPRHSTFTRPARSGSRPTLTDCFTLGIALFWVMSLLHTGIAQGEERTEPPPAAEPTAAEPAENLAVSAHVLAPAFGVYYLETTVRLGSGFALLVNANHFSVERQGWEARATAIGVGMVYHCRGTGLRGLYVEGVGELLLSFWRQPSEPNSAPYKLGSSMGALMGYRFIWDAGPLVDLGGGAAWIFIPSASGDGQRAASPELSQVYPTVKLNLGWAF